MDTEILQELGLTQSEIKIYLMLLKNGKSLAGEISTKTGLHRRSVYDSIQRMMDKGIVSSIKTNNRQYFEAAQPQKLLDIIKEYETRITDILPELERIYQKKQESGETLFFRGKAGLKTIFNEQIETGKEIMVLGGSVKADDILKFYFPHFDRQRKEKNIHIKIIFDESTKNNDMLKNIPLSQIKFIPKEYATPTAINIYGDNVAIILWSENPLAILIREKDIADSYRKYFDLLWSVSKK